MELPSFSEFNKINEQLRGEKIKSEDKSHSLKVRRVDRFDPGRGKGSFVVKLKYKDEFDPAILDKLIRSHPDLETYMTGLVENGPFFYTYKTVKDRDGKEKAVFQLVKAEDDRGNKLFQNYPPIAPIEQLEQYKIQSPEVKKDADAIANSVSSEVEGDLSVEIDVAPEGEEAPETETLDSELVKYLEPLPISKNSEFSRNVENLQKLIIALGGELPKFGVDGKFGDETIKALNDLGIISGSTFQPVDIKALDQKLTEAGVNVQAALAKDVDKIKKEEAPETETTGGGAGTVDTTPEPEKTGPSDELKAKAEELKSKIKVVGKLA